IMLTPPELFRVNKALSYNDIKNIARDYAKENNIVPKNASGNALLEIAHLKGINTDETKLKDKKKVKRIDALELISKLSEKI
ncbi:MAG: hypothetical protein IKK18_05700, partial [Clostridia bacterium]|nr:hypothetical protein [Clostridia bacterium]